MSTCWYFHSFPMATFNQVFGSATCKEEKKFVKLIKSGEEGFEDDDEQETALELVQEMLHKGISYAGKTDEQQLILDSLIKLSFHWVGLAKELKIKARSAEPITLRVAEELHRHGSTIDAKLLACFLNGRRYGTSQAAKDTYFILSPAEIKEMNAEVGKLLKSPTIKWSHPDFPKAVRTNLADILDKVSAEADTGLFATLT